MHSVTNTVSVTKGKVATVLLVAPGGVWVDRFPRPVRSVEAAQRFRFKAASCRWSADADSASHWSAAQLPAKTAAARSHTATGGNGVCIGSAFNGVGSSHSTP